MTQLNPVVVVATIDVLFVNRGRCREDYRVNIHPKVRQYFLRQIFLKVIPGLIISAVTNPTCPVVSPSI